VMLKRLGLTQVADQAVRSLPLGWRQKLAFSVALVHQPRIVFLDEPTSGVDPITRRQFWELIYEAASNGTTVLVTTHYMDEATRCDRVALMHRGRLLDVDTPDAITRAFERPLFGVRAKDRYKALLALRKYEQAHSAYPFGDVIHYTDKRADVQPERIANDLRAFLTANGFHDASVEPLTPTVEDSFIARTEDAA